MRSERAVAKSKGSEGAPATAGTAARPTRCSSAKAERNKNRPATPEPIRSHLGRDRTGAVFVDVPAALDCTTDAGAEGRIVPIPLSRERRLLRTDDKAPVAVPKVGQCPSGWVQSGAYCLDARRR